MGSNTSASSSAIDRKKSIVIDIVIGLVVGLFGLGTLSGFGVYDTASRQVLADKCMYSMRDSAGLDRDALNRALEECREFRGMSIVDAMGELLGQMPSANPLGTVVVVAFTGAVIFHRVIGRRKFGRSIGELILLRRIPPQRPLPPPTAPDQQWLPPVAGNGQ